MVYGSIECGLSVHCISYPDQMLTPFENMEMGKDTVSLILATRGDDGASGKGFVVPTLELGRNRSEIFVVDSSL
jgi:hypothetical protein